MKENIIFRKTAAGIPVVVDSIPNADTAVFMVAVRTGSRDETKEIGGISHLLEHVVFRATSSKTSFQMSKEIEGAGGEMNAFTGREMTAFYAATIKETSEIAKDMVSDIILNPLINENDVDLEKKIVLQEISMRDSDPELYAHKVFDDTVWKGNELSNDEAGEADIVSKFTSADLKKYYEERYRIPNIAIIASGAVGEDVVEWAQETFDKAVGGRRMERTVPEKKHSEYRFAEGKDEHTYVGIGFRSFPADHKDIPALSVLSAILGAGMSSRLFQKVREENALVYSVHSSVDQHSDAGCLETFMSSTPRNVMTAIDTSMRVYKEFKDNGLMDGELQRAKNLIKGANARQMESTINRCYRMTRRFMLTGSPESVSDRIKAIEAVTQDDVMRVANEIIVQDNLNMIVYGKKSKELKNITIEQFDL